MTDPYEHYRQLGPDDHDRLTPKLEAARAALGRNQTIDEVDRCFTEYAIDRVEKTHRAVCDHPDPPRELMDELARSFDALLVQAHLMEIRKRLPPSRCGFS